MLSGPNTLIKESQMSVSRKGKLFTSLPFPHKITKDHESALPTAVPLSLEFSDLNFGLLKIVVSYYAVHLLREPNPLGLVIKALNGTTYLKDRNIHCNKIITSV